MSAGTRWLLAIVGLLVGNVIAMVILIAAAHDGGSRVLPSYYDRATHYNDAIEQAAKNRELGWHIVPTIEHGVIDVKAFDRDGQPLAGARVHVVGSPRTTTGLPIDAELAGEGGEYRAPALSPGWIDLTITIERGGDRFVEHTAIEARG